MKAFTGTWQITSSPDFNGEYLAGSGSPYVRLRQQGDRIEGEYAFGPQHGYIDGRPDGSARIVFSFEGMDGEELVNGAGIASLRSNRLLVRLMYHFGPDRSLEGIRQNAPGAPANG